MNPPVPTISMPAKKRGRGKSARSVALIDWAVHWFAHNHPASVRACCYQLFVAGLIPSMEKNCTNEVSRHLRDAREAGVLPWHHVVDETREAETAGTWANPDQIIDAAVRGYRRDYWQDQPERVEVWSEKGTVRGTILPVLKSYGVTFQVAHGYNSATRMYDAAQDSIASDKTLTILYIGDFDPSSLHMSEVDIPRRLQRYGGIAEIKRIALRRDDLAGLPSFPLESKRKDPRYQWFASRHGRECWELDAMPPNDLRARVENEIFALLDVDLWNHAIQIETAETASMRDFLRTWNRATSGGRA